MPAEIPIDVRWKVIGLWIYGDAPEKVASKAGISPGSVRNIIAEVREGRYPQLQHLLPYLDELRRLSQELRKTNLSVQQALTGSVLFSALMKLGIDPAEFKKLFESLRKIALGDFPVERLVKAALRIEELESETGRSFQDLHSEANTLVSDVATLKEQKGELEKSIKSLRVQEIEARNSLDSRLAANKATTESLEEFLDGKALLKEADLSLFDFEALTDFIKKAKSKSFLDASLELSMLEGRTGQKHLAVVAQYKEALARKEKGDTELLQVGHDTARARKDLQSLQQANSKQLEHNHVTEEQLEQFVRIRHRLAAKGVELEKLGILEGLVTQLEQHHWQPRQIVDYLTKSGDLREIVSQVSQELAKTQKDLDAKKEALLVLIGEAAQERAELQKILSVETTKKTELAQLDQLLSENKLRIDWAETLEKLLRDTAAVSTAQLFRMIEKLQIIIKARETVKDLPINYADPKREFIVLLERVIGDILVPRRKLDAERREFLAEKLKFETASEDQLLTHLVSLVGKGEVRLMWCKNKDCRTGIAIRPGNKRYIPDFYKCPICESYLYDISTSLPPKGATVIVRRAPWG